MKNEKERLWDLSGWKKPNISEKVNWNETIEEMENLFKIPIRKRD